MRNKKGLMRAKGLLVAPCAGGPSAEKAIAQLQKVER